MKYSSAPAVLVGVVLIVHAVFIAILPSKPFYYVGHILATLFSPSEGVPAWTAYAAMSSMALGQFLLGWLMLIGWRIRLINCLIAVAFVLVSLVMLEYLIDPLHHTNTLQTAGSVVSHESTNLHVISMIKNAVIIYMCVWLTLPRRDAAA